MRWLHSFVFILGQALNLAILVRILLSWMPIDRDNRLVRIVYDITDPILTPIQRVIPPVGGLDLSPMIALILIQVVQRILISLLAGVG